MTITALRPIACLLALALLVSCGDDSSTAPPPEDTNVTLESGNAASESIGVEGGTLSTTANDGTVYTLDIPEGSISEKHTITMTPVVDIDGYPVADGVAAGVDLKPAGLVLSLMSSVFPFVVMLRALCAGGHFSAASRLNKSSSLRS